MSKEELMKIKLTKAELVDIIINNFVDQNGNLNLEGLDFEKFDGNIYIGKMKCKHNLNQSNQIVGENLYQQNQTVIGQLFQNNQKRIKGNIRRKKSWVEIDKMFTSLFKQYFVFVILPKINKKD